MGLIFGISVLLLALGPTRLESMSAAISALAALAMAVYTAVLATITKASADAAMKSAVTAQESAEISRRTFLSVHRPRVVVRRVALDGSSGQVSYALANTGDSWATVIGVSARVWRPTSSENLPAIPPYAPRELISLRLQGGESATLTCAIEDGIMAEYQLASGFWQVGHRRPNFDGRPEPVMLFIGHVDYVDELGRSRQTGFLRSLTETGRFYPVAEPDYEYQD